MGPESWSRIKEIYIRALELEPAERPGFLERECQGDASLRDEVSGLLELDPEGFLEEPALGSRAQLSTGGLLGKDGFEFPPSHLAGKRAGPWRLEKEIGRGGMAVVYLGVRADRQFEKLVAVKVLHRDLDREAILGRFQRERQALATLEHPNIARLLDGGVTSEGFPFLVMEYVEGTPIDRFCVERKLSREERIGLFLRVCRAVSHAHSHLLVHRDLKPGNILVTAEGEPKLLDFGLAKVVEPDPGSSEAGRTQPLELLMTPEYASPEHAKGCPITTAADVYSLGVILYELLSEKRPYEFVTRTPGEIERTICEAEPAASDLPADLDNIVRTALRKEPERRYSSVERLAEDLERFLAGRPVSAQPSTWRYRYAKFLRRNRRAVAAGAFVALAAAGGIAAYLWQRAIADEEAGRALAIARGAEALRSDLRRLVEKELFELSDKLKQAGERTFLRKQMAELTLTLIERLAKEAESDPRLRKDLALVYRTLGDVQGNPHGPNLGDLDGASESYGKAIALLNDLERESPGDPEIGNLLAGAYEELATIAAERGNEELAASYRRSAEEARSRRRAARTGSTVNFLPLADSPAAPFVPAAASPPAYGFRKKPNLVASGLRSGKMKKKEADPSSRGADVPRAVGPRSAFPQAVPVDASAATAAGSPEVLGPPLDPVLKARKKIGLWELALRSEPSNLAHRFRLAEAHRNLFVLQESCGDLEGSRKSFQKAEEILSELAKEDPEDQRVQKALSGLRAQGQPKSGAPSSSESPRN